MEEQISLQRHTEVVQEMNSDLRRLIQKLRDGDNPIKIYEFSIAIKEKYEKYLERLIDLEEGGGE